MKAVGVIFDMDGVLVDSAASHLNSWMELGRRHDLRISPDFFRSTFGRAGRDIVHTMLGRPVDDDEMRALVEARPACAVSA